MDKNRQRELISAIIRVLSKDDRVVFAYLYGSALAGFEGNDIDIAVYTRVPEEPYRLSADLKIALHTEMNMRPDIFDIHILNTADERVDVFGLLYLRNVLEGGQVLIDKEPNVRSDFLERYGFRFRACEGFIQEVLT